MKRIEFFPVDIPVFNGVDELADFMVDRYNIPYVGKAMFQGDIVEIAGLPVLVNSGSLLIVSPKYRGVAWLITDSNEDDLFKLSILKDCAQFDQLLSVELPSYVKNELIATLKGEW